MFSSFQRAVEKAKGVAPPQQPAQERYMFDDMDPDFDNLYRESKLYEESIVKLQRQVEVAITHFKETSQSMCAISESLAVNLKLETGLSMDAVNYLNAMTAISNESIIEFENSIRQQVLNDMEQVLNENRKVEEKMKQRQELLRVHDGLFKESLRNGPSATKEHQDKLAGVRSDFFSTHDRIKLELGLLLRDRIKVYQSILARMSSIQLRLFAKMYTSLRKSSQINRILERRTLERARETIELVTGDQWSGAFSGWSSLDDAMDSDFFLTEQEGLVATEAMDKVMELAIEESVSLAVAVTACEMEVQRQVLEEQERSSPSKTRRMASLFTGAEKVPVPSPNSISTATAATTATTTATAPQPSLSRTNSAVSSFSVAGPALPGTPPTLQQATTTGGKQPFNMESMFKRYLSGNLTVPKKGSDTGATKEGGGDAAAKAAAGDAEDTEEGWLRLEEEFQKSLLRAALRAERKRGSSMEAGPTGDDKGILSSISLSRAFNLPFSLVSKNIDTATSPKAGAVNRNISNDADCDWSLNKDTLKYNESTKSGDLKLLYYYIGEPRGTGGGGAATAVVGVGGGTAAGGGSAAHDGGGEGHVDECANTAEEPQGVAKADDGKEDQGLKAVRRRQFLGCALRYLDVTDLAKACIVCPAWREMLVSDERAQSIWKASIRRAGVPDAYRARFWRYLMYGRPPWLPQSRARASRSKSVRRRSDTVKYQALVARAIEQIQYFERTGHMMAEGGSTVFGVVLPKAEGEEEDPEPAHVEMPDEFGQRRSNWISEIEVDVKRTYVVDRGYELWRNMAAESPAPIGAGHTDQQRSGRGGSGQAGELSDDSSRTRGTQHVDSFDTSKPGTESLGTIDVSGAGELDSQDAGGDDFEHVLRQDSDGTVDEISLSHGSKKPSVVSVNEDISEGGDDDMNVVSQPFLKAVLQDQMSQEDRLSREIQRHRLSRVLWAFAVYNPRVRYCQGMNMVAALLLKVAANDEEVAFWLLVGMCDQFHLDEMWADGMPRLKLCFHVLERLIEMRAPKLHEHFQDCGVHVAMFSSKWFVTLFSNLDTLPLKTVLRIWDVFFVERWSVIFGVSVSLIEMLQGKLKTLDLENILRVMQDPRQALKEAFVGQPRLSITSSTVSNSSSSGSGARRDSDPSKRMSLILMRRTSATAMGDQVLKEIETQFHVHA